LLTPRAMSVASASVSAMLFACSISTTIVDTEPTCSTIISSAPVWQIHPIESAHFRQSQGINCQNKAKKATTHIYQCIESTLLPSHQRRTPCLHGGQSPRCASHGPINLLQAQSGPDAGSLPCPTSLI
jgi:hypothetical protein